MNNRIEELARLAGYYREQDVDGSRFDAMPRQCFEKFAQLIIEDCLVCHHNDDMDRILEHFGVEK